MTFALPQKTRILWQIRAFFILVLLYAVVVSFCRIFLTALLPTTIVLAIGSVFVLLYISIYLKQYKINVNSSVLYITKGVFIKTTIIIPHIRLAYIKSFATPMMGWLKLRCIILKVARGWVLVPELDVINAEKLIKLVKYD